MIDDNESDLARLPEPAPPAMLVRTVMARVSRLADERPPATSGSPAAIGRIREERVASWKDIPAWVMALAGVAIVLVSWINGRFEAGWWRDFISSQIGTTDQMSTPLNGSAVLALGFGLLIYLAGLFAPLRSRPWHDRQSR